MSGFETILLGVDARGVARLTLNRPERHNAMDAAMISELMSAAQQLGSDPAVRVVVLDAAGKSFCAGADLDWMKQQFTASAEQRGKEALRLATMLRTLDEMPKLVIGLIQGPAYGGGVGLAAVCDVTIAGPAAKFALTETKLGLIPATIGPYVHRRIGYAALRRLALHAQAFDGREGKAIGLVSELVADNDLAQACERHVGLALACAPGAIAEAKRLFRQFADGAATEAETIDALVQRWASAETQAGIAAFFDKVKAPWHNE